MTSGKKMSKRAKKMLKKAKKIFVLANLKYFNSYKMMKKKLVLLYNFMTYFFPLGDIKV